MVKRGIGLIEAVRKLLYVSDRELDHLSVLPVNRDIDQLANIFRDPYMEADLQTFNRKQVEAAYLIGAVYGLRSAPRAVSPEGKTNDD